jgi:hypothetical protein
MRNTRKALIALLMLALVAFLAIASDVLAQTNPATILFPTAGSALQGVITVEGRADHPDFAYYELSFTYADLPNPTWFIITERLTTPVSNGPLGLWDTSSIVDGNYILRLEVSLSDGSTLSSVVENLRVRNSTPVETNTPAPILETLTPSPIPPTPTSFPTPVTLSTTNGQTSVVLNLCLGAFFTVLILSALAAYIQTSRATRLSLGSLRTRWMHWRERRRRKGKKI